jgi:methylglutaconyl-CoA hydratase
MVPASRARELGIVQRVFDDAQFSSEVEAYVAKLAAKSASALMLSKRLLYNMDSMSFEAALQAGVEINAIARQTEDCRKGVERFLKKSGKNLTTDKH